MKLHALHCPLIHELFFTLCFCFTPHVFTQDMCPEVSAYKASILSFSSHFIIKNKMPRGHYVTHIISAKSAHIMPFFLRQQPKTDPFGICIEQGHVFTKTKVYFTYFSLTFLCLCPRPEPSVVELEVHQVILLPLIFAELQSTRLRQDEVPTDVSFCLVLSLMSVFNMGLLLFIQDKMSSVQV